MVLCIDSFSGSDVAALLSCFALVLCTVAYLQSTVQLGCLFCSGASTLFSSDVVQLATSLTDAPASS